MTTITKKRKEYYKRPYEERGISSNKPFVNCVCPKCEAVHRMRLKWIGRGIPKKFCPSCRGKIGRLKGLPEDVSGYKFNGVRRR
jgi:transposase-like protein